MRAVIKIENPKGVEVTLNLTMSLGDWIILREKLPAGWPVNELGYAINDAVMKVQRQLDVETAPEPTA